MKLYALMVVWVDVKQVGEITQLQLSCQTSGPVLDLAILFN